MMDPAILLAVYLHRPVPLVDAVFHAGGLDAVAVVEMESNFVPWAERREPRGHSSYGLWQLDDEWHPQYRNDLSAHIAYGTRFLEKCKQGRTLAQAAAVYNGGGRPGAYSKAWGARVERKRDELARWLRWREIRELGVAQ